MEAQDPWESRLKLINGSKLKVDKWAENNQKLFDGKIKTAEHPTDGWVAYLQIKH